MRPLVREDQIQWWDDTMIAAGAEWRKEIGRALASTRVAVLLISADFLASDFVADDEMPALLKAAEDKGAVIIPLIVSPSRFKEMASLAQFQPINPPSQPLAGLGKSKQEEYLVKAADAILQALAVRAKRKPTMTLSSAKAARAARPPRTKREPSGTDATVGSFVISHASIDFGRVTSPDDGRRLITLQRRSSGAAGAEDVVWATADGDWFNVISREQLVGRSFSFDVLVNGRPGEHKGQILFHCGKTSFSETDHRLINVSAVVEVPDTLSAKALYAAAERDFGVGTADYAYLWRLTPRLDPNDEIRALWLIPREGLIVATEDRLVFVFGDARTALAADAVRYSDIKFTVRQYKGGKSPTILIATTTRRVELRALRPPEVIRHIANSPSHKGEFGADELLGPMDAQEVEGLTPGILDEGSAKKPFAIWRTEAFTTPEILINSAADALRDHGATIDLISEHAIRARKGKTKFTVVVDPVGPVGHTLVTFGAAWNGIRILARTRQELEALRRRLLERGVRLSTE
jgi:hypothetical protein